MKQSHKVTILEFIIKHGRATGAIIPNISNQNHYLNELFKMGLVRNEEVVKDGQKFKYRYIADMEKARAYINKHKPKSA